MANIVKILNPNSGGGGATNGLQGTWNASTNTPALSNTDTGKTGVMYQVAVGGTVDFGAGNIIFEAKDIVVNNGTVWDKIDGSDAVLSVSGKTGIVTLTKSDVGLPNVDNTSDANKPISSAAQTALNGKANTSHTHNASDINTGTLNNSRLNSSTSGMPFVVDEDNFASNSATKVPTQQSTKAYVDSGLATKAEIYTMRVSADIVLDDFNDWSAYGGDLVLPVGTYAYNGKLLVSSLDYGNLGIKVQVVKTSGGTIAVDGMYELQGGVSAETGGNDCLRTKLVDNGSSIVDIDEQFPTISVLYGWVDVSGEITVTSSPATLQMRVGRINTGTDAATIYKGSNINFIKL